MAAKLNAYTGEYACVYASSPVGDDPRHFPDLLEILIVIFPFRVSPPSRLTSNQPRQRSWQEVPLLAVVVSYCHSSLVHIEIEPDPHGTRGRFKTERIPAEVGFGIPAKKEHGPR